MNDSVNDSPSVHDSPPDFPVELVDLQTRFAFQEDALQEISAALMRQQAQIDSLQRRCALLERHCDELGTELESRSRQQHQPPPHY